MLPRRHLGDRRGPDALVAASDRRFPPRLRLIANSPPSLFVRGAAGLLAAPKLVAVVGTRTPSPTGEAIAHELTVAVAEAGWGVVSGLAAGVDAVAHRAALGVGAPNIAVIGAGLDQISPRANLPLAEEIVAAGGALLSEHPLGTPTLPAHLVTRNRLLSGIAAAVLIVQCKPGGGTMHTARYAADQGRPIFVPDPPSQGPEWEGLRLLRERYGARSLAAADVADALAAAPLAGRAADQLTLGADTSDDQPSQGSV